MLRELLCAATLALSAWSPAAIAAEGASDLAAARAHADAAYDLYAAGDYARAFERFHSAEKLHHAPPHLLYMGRCLTKLGRLLEARKTYQQLAGEGQPADAPEPFREARREGREELIAVESRIPRITVVVRGAPPDLVRVSIDGRALEPAALSSPLELDPGEHRVAASAEGFVERDRFVSLGEGASETVTLSLDASGPRPGGSDDPVDAERPSLLGPIVLLATGGVGLLLGAVTGGLAMAKQGQLADACPDKTSCPAENRQLEKDGRALGTASTVGFVFGGTAGAAGIAWLIFTMTTSPRAAGVTAGPHPGATGSEARVVPVAGDGTAGLAIRF